LENSILGYYLKIAGNSITPHIEVQVFIFAI